MKMPDDKYQVPALEKAISIVQAIADNNRLTIQDIIDIGKCSKSHLYAILNTLCTHDWLYQGDDKSYHIGETLVRLSTMHLYPLEFVRLFYAELAIYKSNLDFTYQMSILDNTDILYIAKVTRDEDVQIVTYPGMRIAAHCTAMGKVLLAQFNRETLDAMYAGQHLEKITHNTTASVDELWMQISEFKSNGFILEVGEAKIGYSCVAAPIYNAFNRIAAAISITTLIPYPSSVHEQAILKVQQICKNISAKLGYIAPSK